ncbi:MAG: ABC transporter permease [Candidatus Acidiferrales bacterium]
MRPLRAWLVRVGEIFGRHRRDRDLAAELESHLQMHIDDNLRAGMTPEEARRQALIKLGGIEQTKEVYRDRRGLPWIESLLQDVRFGLRMLRKNPGFTTVAILTLALGIGANTAIFSVVSKVLIDPMPYPDANRIVMLRRTFSQGSNFYVTTSIPKYMVWRQQTQVFESAALFDSGPLGLNITGGNRPEQVPGIRTSAGYFKVFDAPIALGRTYTAEEDKPGGPHVAVISYGLWRARFAGDPQIIGRTIEVGGSADEVIGVTGRTFTTGFPTDIWLPLQADPNSNDQAHDYLAVARLRPGVTLAQARIAMKMAAMQFRRKFPGPYMMAGESATAQLFRDSVVGSVRPALLILLGAVGFVLLLACANVANLLLARATVRKREIAIRSALGAGRKRVIRQLLTESLMLSFAGGILGLALGFTGIRVLLARYPNNGATGGFDLPLIGSHGSAVTLDWRVLLFTIGVCLLTAILFGLLPAMQASRTPLSQSLNEGGSRGGSRGGRRRSTPRSALVVSEVAIAVILLAGAALLIRTLSALRALRLGFDPHNVLVMRMTFSGPQYDKTAGLATTIQEAERKVGALPGVQAVALGCCVPLQGGSDLPFSIEGRAPTLGPYSGDEQWRFISPEFFDVMRVPLLRGRVFTDQDVLGSEPVVVIDKAMARRYWPKGDAIGQRLLIGHGLGPEFEEPPRTVVGIVGNTRQKFGGMTGSEIEPVMYVPMEQLGDPFIRWTKEMLSANWFVRTKTAPFAFAGPVQNALREATGGLPVADVRSMDQVMAGSTAWSGFIGMLLSAFAAIAVCLAAIGVYGLMAYSVEQRKQEIGIRMALGAEPRDVRKMILSEGGSLTLAGIFVGVVAGLALTRFMASLLYGVKPWDPVAFGSVIILLGSIALVAAYVPARRAMRVDPMVALRHE